MHASRFVSKHAMTSFAKYLVEDVFPRGSMMILLKGTLGMGKTTLAQCLGEQFGVREDLQSPTYTLMREYPLELPYQRLVHMDLYRLTSLEEVLSYGLFDTLSEERGVYVIEWPELIEEALDLHLPIYEIALQEEGDGRKVTWMSR